MVSVFSKLPVLRDRSLFPGGGGLLFFRKVVGKKYDPPLQHDKKIMTLPQQRVKKIVTLPLSLFFYFHLIFFNKNNIFLQEDVLPPATILHLPEKLKSSIFSSFSSKGGWPFTAIRSACVWWYFLASFFKWRPLMINRVITKDGARGRNEICFLKATSFRMLIKS